MKTRLQRLVMNAQSHPGAMPQAPTCHAVFSSRSLVQRRISGQWSVVRSLRELLSHFLKLLTDYRSVEAIDGDVKPITFFAFHHEVSLKICRIGFVMACLRDHVDEQTPRPRLCDLGERPRKGVSFVLGGGRVERSCVHHAP